MNHYKFCGIGIICFASCFSSTSSAYIFETCDQYEIPLAGDFTQMVNNERLSEGCWHGWDFDQREPYNVNEDHWGDGWGWYRSGQYPDHELGFCRAMTGIRMIEESASGLGDDGPIDQLSVLFRESNMVENDMMDLEPSCDTYFSGQTLPVQKMLGFMVSEFDYTKMSIQTLLETSPVFRAGVLVHEAQHAHGSGMTHQGFACAAQREADGGRVIDRNLTLDPEKLLPNKCDHGVYSGGPYGREILFYKAISEDAGAFVSKIYNDRDRLVPADVWSAVAQGNDRIANNLEQFTPWRLKNPFIDPLIERLPGVVQELDILRVGCDESEQCFWGATATNAVYQNDRCFLTAFSGAFENGEDKLGVKEATSGKSILYSSSHSDDWNQAPGGEAICLSGGDPRRYNALLPVGDVHSSGKYLSELNGFDSFIEEDHERVCYITRIQGDLNNGDYVEVAKNAPPNPYGYQWYLKIYSNFSNDEGVFAEVECSNGRITNELEVSNDAYVVVNGSPSTYCAITAVGNDFAGVDERIVVQRKSDGAWGTWEILSQSNRPGDGGGEIWGRVTCFEPLW